MKCLGEGKTFQKQAGFSELFFVCKGVSVFNQSMRLKPRLHPLSVSSDPITKRKFSPLFFPNIPFRFIWYLNLNTCIQHHPVLNWQPKRMLLSDVNGASHMSRNTEESIWVNRTPTTLWNLHYQRESAVKICFCLAQWMLKGVHTSTNGTFSHTLAILHPTYSHTHTKHQALMSALSRTLSIKWTAEKHRMIQFSFLACFRPRRPIL